MRLALRVDDVQHRNVRTILVVDDQDGVRVTLRMILQRAGYSSVVVTSARAALEAYDAHPVDGVISDVYMPGENGVDLCREIKQRARAAGRELPVWLMTGAPTTELRRMAVDAGAACLFAKPFEIEELVRELHQRVGAPVVVDPAAPVAAVQPALGPEAA